MSVIRCFNCVLFIGVVSFLLQPCVADTQFDVGNRVGKCLARGCVVYTGTISRVGDLSLEAGIPSERAMGVADVMLAEVRMIHGTEDPSEDSSVNLKKFVRPMFSKNESGPWNVWTDVDLDGEGPLTILEIANKETVYGGRPIRPIQAVFDDTAQLKATEAFVELHERLHDNPAGLSSIPRPPVIDETVFRGFVSGWMVIMSKFEPQLGLNLIELLGDPLIPEYNDFLVSMAVRRSFGMGGSELRTRLMTTLFRRAASVEDRRVEAVISTAAAIVTQNRVPADFEVDETLRQRVARRYLDLDDITIAGGGIEGFEKLIGVRSK